MPQSPHFHLAIMQPPGYVHSLGFLDPARYVRYQLRRLGMKVSISKNRLREDAINLVFGSHLGFDPALRARYAYLICNFEQLGPGGAHLSPDYLRLLKSSAVVDYDVQNVPHYCADAQDVPLLPFYSAPYLKAENAPPLEDRPIDLLFFGSMNERRKAFIQRVEASGIKVAVFDRPLYGPERDEYIRQAKAVLNCHFYESSRFETIRASHCLSLGTPVISERSLQVPMGFDEAVFWLDEAQFANFFQTFFKSELFYTQAREKMLAFATIDPIENYADLVGFAAGFVQGYLKNHEPAPWRPDKVNLGSGKDYRLGWLNIDVLDKAEPDLVLDLGQPVEWPVQAFTRFGSALELEQGSVGAIYANNVLEHVPDLVMLMSNALALLKEGGTFEIEVPYEKSPTAWQDPTHLRALNENSWVYYTDWFWYLGWFEHRFEITDSSWLDLKLQPCTKNDAAFMRVVLRKVITSDQERNLARVMRADFGGLDADDPADTDIFFTFEDDTVDLPDWVKKPGTNLAQGHPQGPTITTPSASVLNTVSKAMFQEAFSS
ncbi:MAG: methyltransferase domain-containing protein [Burkholderiales bacterium]